MKRYKISESNLKEFWGWFGNKQKPNKLQSVIDNDPVLRKLDDEMQDMLSSYVPKIRKMKEEKPELFKYMQDAGLIPKNFK